MVFESLKKMLGGDDEKDKPPEPVLEKGSKKPPSRRDMDMPSTDDLGDMDPNEMPPPPTSSAPAPRESEGRDEGMGWSTTRGSDRRDSSSPSHRARGDQEGSGRRDRGSSSRESRSRERRPGSRSPGSSRQRRETGDRPSTRDSRRQKRNQRRRERDERRGPSPPELDRDDMSGEMGVILDHLDRLEERLSDIDRRLAMLERKRS